MSEAQARIDDSVTANVPKAGDVPPRHKRTDAGLIPKEGRCVQWPPLAHEEWRYWAALRG